MNPDIQRIAEKHFPDGQDGYFQHRGLAIEALTEFAALRDTQEREQLDSIRLQGENLRNLMEAAHHGWMKERVKTSSLLGKIHDLRTELARRDEVEKELRELIKKSDLEEVDSCVVASDSCGAPILRNSGKILRHRGYMSEVNEKTKLLQQLASKARENASLLSRIGELETKLGERA